ncbi:MAG: hypothetical protein OES57_07690 [Acidimicrobiia bacterium]|nr:hypothetical protein [Acidimicrobiia bacterium]
MRRLVFVISLALVAAACSSSGDDQVATGDTGPPPVSEGVAPAPSTTAPTVTLPDYSAEVASLPQAANDASLPEMIPSGSVGAYGFSRYVYQSKGDEVVPTLIEGPLGRQTRCQELDQLCSYTELIELYDSGEEIPGYLNMDRDTLGELIDQLDRVNRAVMQYPTLDDACAAGLFVASSQNANMGIHVYDPGAGSGFDPDRPQMILFAKEGGERIPRPDIGRCDGDTFTGEAGFVPVGAVFNIALSPDHPDAFAGELDNWHIHYNTCSGGTAENEDQVNPESDVNGASATREECEASGGQFLPVISSWMMHTYVVPEFDPQGGVFSMFNPNVWPLADSPEDLEGLRTIQDPDAVAAPINNFDYGEIAAGVGETIRFANSDSVPHTVTSGSALDPTSEFDSGVLGTGQTYDLSFETPGEYPLFCVLHPEMQATVVVS